MATLTELQALYGRGETASDILFNKVTAAVMIAAEAVRNEVDTTLNHANRLKWAKHAWTDPVSAARQIWPALLAANAGATSSQITGASDTAIQTAVNNTINIFADGL